MKMKKKEKVIIGILVAIALIVVIVLIAINQKGKDKEEIKENKIINEVQEEFVEKTENGTRINISNKLKETKIIDGLEVKDFFLRENGNVSFLSGRIENNTNQIKGGYPVDIIVVNKEGEDIARVGGFIKELKPEESTILNCSATVDYANAYDIRIVKK